VEEDKMQLEGTNSLKYIKYGENLEVEVTRGSELGRRLLPELQTIKTRDKWYSVPNLPDAPIFFQYLIDESVKAFWNKAHAQAPNVLHCVIPSNRDHLLPLLAYFNSSVCALLVELYGRSYGGGVLKIEVYELKDLPTIDPSVLSRGQLDDLTRTFKKLVKAVDTSIMFSSKLSESKQDRKNYENYKNKYAQKMKDASSEVKIAQNELDEIVFEILNLSQIEKVQVKRGLKELQEMRRLRASPVAAND
jgi:hypothetical protein